MLIARRLPVCLRLYIHQETMEKTGAYMSDEVAMPDDRRLTTSTIHPSTLVARSAAAGSSLPQRLDVAGHPGPFQTAHRLSLATLPRAGRLQTYGPARLLIVIRSSFYLRSHV